MAYIHLVVELVSLILYTSMVFFPLLGLGDSLILLQGHSLSSCLIRMLILFRGLFILLEVVCIGGVPIVSGFLLLMQRDSFLLLLVL